MRSNLKLFFRRFYRNKVFGILNIAGLAVGVAISLVIFLIIKEEISIDRFHKNRDRIYRVVSTETFRNGVLEYDGDVPLPLPDFFRKEFPQPEKIAAVYRSWAYKFVIPGKQEKKFNGSQTYFAEPSFFDIFDFPWLSGNPHTALNEPYTAVISRTTANNWFGNWQDAVGKTVQLNNHENYKITGVMEDAPVNTDLNFPIVLSYATFRLQNQKQIDNPLAWDNFSGDSQCFFMLKEGQKIGSMEAMLPGFVARHFTPLFANSDTRDSCFFQPFKEMHFDPRMYRFGDTGWSSNQLIAIGMIGAFILIMACINFINLATAQSLNRGKEVGVRKVLGSNPRQLFLNFIIETGMLVTFAILLGCTIAYISLPALSQILGKPITANILNSGPTCLFLIILGLVLTWVAGFYPGMVLSRFEPIAAIKSKINAGTIGGISLRRALIVLQFVIAQMMIIGTIIVARQMDFFRDRPMGFDRKAIAMINIPYTDKNNFDKAYFKSGILKLPGVLSATLCSEPPSVNSSGTSYFTYMDHPHPENFETAFRFGDSDYLSTFHIRLLLGRYPYPSDTAKEVVLNETMVKKLGLKPEDVIGKYIRWGNITSPKLPIVGVVADFNTGSLKEKTLPLLMLSASNSYYSLAVKLNPASIKNTMSQIKQVYTSQYPDFFMNASFLDNTVRDFYNTESIASKLFKIFAGLAIFISCLGLYGLISFMTIQKTKEVGIRKVLGASVANVVYIFSKEFTQLILIAFVLSAPLGYYFMNKWVSSFSYHISIDWTVFALAILLSIIIAWVTVGYKAVKAANANPVNSLRSE